MTARIRSAALWGSAMATALAVTGAVMLVIVTLAVLVPVPAVLVTVPAVTITAARLPVRTAAV